MSRVQLRRGTAKGVIGHVTSAAKPHKQESKSRIDRRNKTVRRAQNDTSESKDILDAHKECRSFLLRFSDEVKIRLMLGKMHQMSRQVV